jgi:alkanesulfonate monooxygenase SsuD/methylene tetrahydromethanopterin reductase-like flavin-dependent oxidoreductase (luciferase family)
VDLAGLQEFARAAASLGYRYLSANDHMLFSRPWLDGPTALAAVLDASEDLTLATSVSLPAVRGPVPLAKTLAAIDRLSGGRLLVGLGPGSSERDYAAVGLPAERRWERFEESVGALRALLAPDAEPFAGEFYSTAGVRLEPPPLRPGGPQLWIGSWGSRPGLRRLARVADGWMASGYNTTPQRFAASRHYLDRQLANDGRPGMPNALVTLWLYVADDPKDADRVLADVLGPMIRRPIEELRAMWLPVGTPEVCAKRLSAFAAAGVERMFVWPLADDLRQLERFAVDVAPKVATAS